MLVETIKDLIDGKKMNEQRAFECLNYIMDGKATEVQKASFLTALRVKGETVDEITGFAKAMKQRATILYPNSFNCIDTCGTGGDSAGTFNISTAAAIVAAASGSTIAKHGNRSVSSKCGSADVLEALGVNINLSATEAEECINTIGIGFLFAPNYHIAMKNVAQVRKELGIRTVFNVLGPLLNPANTKAQVMGVYHKNLVLPIAQVLKRLGTKKAMVVHGEDGLDEITLTGKTFVAEINEEEMISYELNPTEYGFTLCSLEDLIGGDAKANAVTISEILQGKKGPKADITVMNSAAALYVAGNAKTLQEGIELSKKSIVDGRAYKKLQDLVSFKR